MSGGIKWKVCGLRTQADARFAAEQRADAIAFNIFPQSPRFIPLEQAQELAAEVSGPAKGLVTVEPSSAELERMAAGGFDFFQIHFRPEISLATLSEWSRIVSPARLWLAPKLPPGTDVAPARLPLADTFLLDTFDAAKFGGTGKTGDWGKFARHRQANPEKTWILSGGLTPENIKDAIKASGATYVDVNSGVESAPGVKDPARVRAFVAALA